MKTVLLNWKNLKVRLKFSSDFRATNSFIWSKRIDVNKNCFLCNCLNDWNSCEIKSTTHHISFWKILWMPCIHLKIHESNLASLNFRVIWRMLSWNLVKLPWNWVFFRVPNCANAHANTLAKPMIHFAHKQQHTTYKV